MGDLGMSRKQVDDLKGVFAKVDFDDSGEIDTEEFFEYFGIPATSFASSIFELFDTDGSGGIDFYEFAIGLYNFLSLDAKGGARSIAKFAFTLYDRGRWGRGGFKRLSPSLSLSLSLSLSPHLSLSTPPQITRASSTWASSRVWFAKCRTTRAWIQKLSVRVLDD